MKKKGPSKGVGIFLWVAFGLLFICMGILFNGLISKHPLIQLTPDQRGYLVIFMLIFMGITMCIFFVSFFIEDYKNDKVEENIIKNLTKEISDADDITKWKLVKDKIDSAEINLIFLYEPLSNKAEELLLK